MILSEYLRKTLHQLELALDYLSKADYTLQPEDFPDIDADLHQIHVLLPTDLVAEVDAIRDKYRFDRPEVCAYRKLFIEAALRYFMRVGVPQLYMPKGRR